MNQKISVIVPVYNVEDCLCKCIDSVLAQTFRNFELILINDGSKDNSGTICDNYARKDKRIRVFHQENRGVSPARNCGIENACGSYITFIDSDDYVEPDYLSIFSFSTVKADLYMQNIRVIDTIRNKVTFRKFDKTEFYNGIKQAYFAAEKSTVITCPYVKLFNRSIILEKKIRFDNTLSNGEDLVFVLSYMFHIKTVFISNHAAYNHIICNRNSLSKRVIPFNTRKEFMIRVYNLRKQLMERHKITDTLCFEYIDYQMVSFYLSQIVRLYYRPFFSERKKRARYIGEYREYVSKNYKLQHIKQKTSFMKLFSFILNSNIFFKDFFLYAIVRIRSLLNGYVFFIRRKLSHNSELLDISRLQ